MRARIVLACATGKLNGVVEPSSGMRVARFAIYTTGLAASTFWGSVTYRNPALGMAAVTIAKA